ncbi:MAG: hypothetical protein NCW75_03750 [Phycisphaera sp.]|nr:MAG: hypothetical protein NCW75_03750 [Phycisphaera sp.]
MQRRTATRALTTPALLAACGALALGMGGCYRKVVDSRGIGADSVKLRSEYESRPLDFMTTENRRDKREVRSAREREK